MNASDVARLALQVVADECRKSLFFFLQTFWDVVIRETPIYNWHIPYLCEELQKLSKCIINREPKPYDLIINIPPGTTKSTLVSVMWPVWLWIKDPTIRIISNSYSGILSVDLAGKSKDIIMSDKFRKLFPEVCIRKDMSGKQHYGNAATGIRYATSTGATITGFHAHVIINDDPQNPRQADSTMLRLQATEHTKTLATRKVDKENTPIVTIMQRLHDEDVTGFLLSRKGEKIKHICLPAELSDFVFPRDLRAFYKDGLLDPYRLGRNALEEAKIDLGSRGYAGQYEQNPTIDGGNIVKADWFQHVSAAEFARMHTNQPIVFFIDTAFTESASNDPTGIIATCKIGNELYITHAEKVQLKFPDLIRHIGPYVQSQGYGNGSSIRIEPKANGISVVDQLKDQTGLNVVRTPSPRDSKETRLNVASPSVEAGRVVLVDGPWNESFVDEVCGFPAKPHDEYVDVLCYAVDYHLQNPFKPIDRELIGRIAF